VQHGEPARLYSTMRPCGRDHGVRIICPEEEAITLAVWYLEGAVYIQETTSTVWAVPI
jgi:hypothetical protein